MKIKDAPYNWSHDKKYPGITVPMTLTNTAGLGVTHSRRLRVNSQHKTQEVIILKSWDIVTYPSGHPVIQGIKTKGDAVCIAESYLHKFSWVCMFYSDFEKNNDMKAVRKELVQIKNQWGLR